MATSKQAKKIIEIFEDVETDPMQQILGSGVLTVVRDKPELHSLIYGVARGTHEIRPIDHIIDRSKMPKLPFNGATVEEHKGSGISKIERREDGLYVDGHKVVFHLEKEQKSGTIVGTKLREKLAKKPVLDANILDYLFEHRNLIPEDWKQDEQGRTRFIFFWGTIYRNADGDLYVRCLCWLGGGWRVNYRWLGVDWNVRYPSAQLAS